MLIHRPHENTRAAFLIPPPSDPVSKSAFSGSVWTVGRNDETRVCPQKSVLALLFDTEKVANKI